MVGRRPQCAQEQDKIPANWMVNPMAVDRFARCRYQGVLGCVSNPPPWTQNDKHQTLMEIIIVAQHGATGEKNDTKASPNPPVTFVEPSSTSVFVGCVNVFELTVLKIH